MDDFSKDVISEIRDRGITPRPFWYFLLRRGVFWTLAVLSVFIGAIALSVADYVFFDSEGVSSAVLIESPLEGILQGAPIVWLILFALFVTGAYLSLKKTQTVYKFKTIKTVVLVAGVTLLLGLILISFDFGHTIYYYLTHDTSFYEAVLQTSDDIVLPF
ncbi:MAG: protein of unknown function with transrane region [Parcubacteria group bacterium]|nr:protein of unknown function with transrane region [Parcubacteria group bacterium]